MGQTIDQASGEPVSEVSVDPKKVTKKGDVMVLADDHGIRVESRAFKMSKSRGNVVNPDEIVKDYGADSLRLYEMFMGPLEATKPWSMHGVSGVRNFLDRAWRMMVDDRSEQPVLAAEVQDVEPTEEQNRVLHRTIREVTQDTQNMEFNTAIARMMEFVNFFTKQTQRPTSAMQQFTLLLSPYAPHIAEELWQILGHDDTLAYESWPAYDEAMIREDTVEIPVQFGKKVRARIQVPADCSREQLEEAARSDPDVAALLDGKEIIKVIVVPGRLVNFTVK
jgi:leucyl-tRNA synthetase